MSAAPCTLCGHANPAESNFCNACGASLQLTLCNECEAINHRSAAICHKCGALLPIPSSIAAIELDVPSDGSVPGSPSISVAPATSADATPTTWRARSTLPATPAFVALAVVALTAAAYYAYLHDGIAPLVPSTLRHALGDSQSSQVASAPELVRNVEPVTSAGTEPTTATEVPAAVPSGTISADDAGPSVPATSAPAPSAVREEQSPASQPRQAASPQAAAAPATNDSSERSQRSKDHDVGRDRSVVSSPSATYVPTPPPTSRGSPSGARFEPPSKCTAAIAALGLCNRTTLDDGH